MIEEKDEVQDFGPRSDHEQGEAFDVQKEAEELGEILDEMSRLVTLPDLPEEKFYPVNRAARRNADKRNRALKKRKPNG